MVVCKCRLFCERCWTTKKLRYGYRCLSNRISGPIINYSDDFIQVIEGNNGGSSSRTAVINRASSLNAINNPMAVRLRKLYREWEDDPDIGFVMLKGRGRAFSAGGDLRSLYNLMKQGKLEECKELFRNVYGLVHNIATYSKPHVAMLSGITMGGGAGISVLGTFRVATHQLYLLLLRHWLVSIQMAVHLSTSPACQVT